MRRTFLSNLALVVVLNLLVKPFYILGIDAEVQERVGPAVYGGYAALLALSFLLNIVLDLGITNHNTRAVAQNESGLHERIGAVLGIRVLLVLVYAVLTFVVAWMLGYGQEQWPVLGALVLNQALAQTILYFRSNLAGAQRFAEDSLLSVLDRVLLVGICAVLLWSEATAGAFRIEWFVVAQTFSYAVALAVALFAVRGMGVRPLPQWRSQSVLPLLRECFPYALLILLMTIYYRVDTVMLERIGEDGPTQAGLYTQGFRFLEALNMLGFLFAGLLLPMFSRMLKDGGDVVDLAGLAWRTLLAACLPIAVAGLWWGAEILGLRYDVVTPCSAIAFGLLMCAFTAVATTYVFGTLLTAHGDLRLLNRIAFAGVVCSVAINAWAIPRYGAVGAAVACVVTQGLTALAQVWLVKRQHSVAVPWRRVLQGFGYAAALVLLAEVLERSGITILPCLTAFAATALVLAFATGLLRVPQLRRLLRSARRP